jgi:HlyD family secretion protein
MKTKRWWYLAGVAVIVAAGLYGWRTIGRSEKIEYRFDHVDRGDLVVSISATGTLNAVTTVQVGSQVSGTISRLAADFNSVVKKGQVIAQLDPTFLQASVNEQRANVSRAQAQFDDANRTVKRQQDLFAKSLVAQADLDAATTNYAATKAGLEQAKAALQRNEVNLQYATITAPISGVVISRNVDVGQTVAASFSAPTLFTIANDLRKMQVQASVDESDIGNVKAGQDVTFRVDSYPERDFRGRVSQVRLAPVVSQNVVTYNVIIDVSNDDLPLMPGMTATVTIGVEKHENVLRVPIQASRFTPADAPIDQVAGAPVGDPKERTKKRNTVRLWVMNDGRPRQVSAVRGLQNMRYLELAETELKEGDEVIVGSNAPQQQQAAGGGQQNPFQPRNPMGGGGGRRF